MDRNTTKNTNTFLFKESPPTEDLLIDFYFSKASNDDNDFTRNHNGGNLHQTVKKNKLHKVMNALTLVSLLAVTFSAEARFEFLTRADGQRVVKTYAKKGEGLASIIRDLGLEPNWQDQSWITNIQQANPSLVNSSNNFVATPETPLIIPVDGLTMLRGHSQLAGQFSSVAPTPEPPQEVATMVVETEVIPEPQTEEITTVTVAETDSGMNAEKSATDVDLTIGYGYSNLEATRSTFIDTSLNSNLNLVGSLNVGFNITEIQRFSVFATGRLIEYSAPPTIGLLQDNTFIYDAGLSYGLRLGGETYLSLLISAQKQHMVRFNTTNLEILAPTVFGVGGQLQGSIASLANSKVTYTLTPQYLLETTDILNVLTGFQMGVKIQWQPYNGLSGMIVGAEYIYRAQDDVLSQQTFQTGTGFLGYRF